MKVVTFHSYKGGAGRSSTALNTLPYLVNELGANKKSPILVLDMDIASAGMTYLLDSADECRRYDIIRFFRNTDEPWTSSEVENLEEYHLYKKFIPVGEKVGIENKAVLFLGVNDDEIFDTKELNGPKGSIFKKLCDFCDENNFSALVFDSSTGYQDTAKISIKLSHIIVHCLRATKQFRTGSFNYLYKRNKDDKAFDGKSVILLPTVVPDAVDSVSKPRCEAAIDDIIKKIKILGLDNLIKKDFLDRDQFGINEVERFKWEEGVLYKDGTNTKDEEEAAKRYEKLAQVIARCN